MNVLEVCDSAAAAVTGDEVDVVIQELSSATGIFVQNAATFSLGINGRPLR